MSAKVVIIGGSYAGVAVLTSLLSQLPDAAVDITLIESRSHFFNKVAAVRTVSEGQSHKVWIPYTNLLSGRANSRVVHASVREVMRDRVVLVDGKEVAFDYAVVATGSRIAVPGGEFEDRDQGVESINAVADAVKAAKSVVIVGGGAVGIEITGEIATDHPGVHVTLIHSGAELLSAVGIASAWTRSSALSNLRGHKNVTVMLGESVLPAPGATAPNLLPGGKYYHAGKLELVTNKGTKVESDVQFVATGIQRPNSEIVKALGADVVDAKGFIRVRKTGQLLDHAHIFALGDVADLDDAKFAYVSGFEAPVIAGNIVTLIKNSSATKLKDYARSINMLALAIGRKGGVTQLPFYVMGNWFTKAVKSADLLQKKSWDLLKAEMPKNV
ncbi:Apoptosis-inducing factor 2 [Irineochytrium annulatum]|nr:Apoptosis-inducing factor 2 [Irineochytrium annulatum]